MWTTVFPSSVRTSVVTALRKRVPRSRSACIFASMKDFKFLKSRSLPCNSTSSSTSDTTACTFSNHCGLSFGIIEVYFTFAITLHRWKWQRQIHRITLFILHLHLNELTRRYRTVSRLNDVDTFQKSFVLRLDGELFQFQYLVGLQRTFAILVLVKI